MNLVWSCHRYGVPPSGGPDRLKPGLQTGGSWRVSARASSSSLAAQRVRQTQTHRLNGRQNSGDKAECDRQYRAEDQVARRNKKNGEKLPDKTCLAEPRHQQPAEQQTEETAEDGDRQRFAQNDAEHELVGKAQRLEQAQL